MALGEAQRIHEFEGEYWWYRALHCFLLKQVPLGFNSNSLAVDMGCGTGYFLDLLVKRTGGRVLGVEIDSDMIAFARSRSHEVMAEDILRASELLASGSVDAFYFNDTLYFYTLAGQKRVLENCLRALKPRGSIFIHLPAGKIFAREHDKVVGIRSRAEKHVYRRLIGEIESSVPLKTTLRYRVCVLSLLILMRKWLQRISTKKEPRSDLALLPKPLNGFFRMLQMIEDLLPNVPWGSSLFIEIQRADYLFNPRESENGLP